MDTDGLRSKTELSVKRLTTILLILLGMATPAWAFGPEAVTWQAVDSGITATTTSVLKNGGGATTGWNAGASSTQVIPASAAGYVEFSCTDGAGSLVAKMGGLNDTVGGSGHSDIEFVVYCLRQGIGLADLYARSLGVDVNAGASIGTFIVSDVLRLAKTAAGSVTIEKDSGAGFTVLHTFSLIATTSLLADFAIYSVGEGFTNPTIQGDAAGPPTWYSNATYTAGAQSSVPGPRVADVTVGPTGLFCDQLGGDGSLACAVSNDGTKDLRIYHAPLVSGTCDGTKVDTGADPFQTFAEAATETTTVRLTGMPVGESCAEAHWVDASGQLDGNNVEISTGVITDDTDPPVWTGAGAKSIVAVSQDNLGAVTVTWTEANDAAPSDPVSYSVCARAAPGAPAHRNNCTDWVVESSACTGPSCTMMVPHVHPGSMRFAVFAKDSLDNQTAYDDTDTATLTITEPVGPDDLQLYNGAAFSGGVVTLDGVNDYIGFQANPAFDRVDDFTISVRKRFDPDPDSQLFWFPFGKYDGTSGPTGMVNGNWSANSCAAANVNTFNQYDFGGGLAICNGPATEIVMGSTYRFTLSCSAGSCFTCVGGLCGTPTAVTVPTSTVPWTIGNRGNLSSTFISGTGDEVQYWNRGLSAAEVVTMDAITDCDPTDHQCFNMGETGGVIAKGGQSNYRGMVESGAIGETLTGPWSTVSSSLYSSGSALLSTAAGSTYTQTVKGCGIFPVVRRMQPGEGSIVVQVDNAVGAPILLDHPYMRDWTDYHVPLLAHTDTQCGWHTIKITTQDSNPVVIDGIAAIDGGYPTSRLTDTLTLFGDSVTQCFGVALPADCYGFKLAAAWGLTESNRGHSGLGVNQALQDAFDGIDADLPKRVTILLPLNNTRHNAKQYLPRLEHDMRSLLAWITGLVPGAEVYLGNNTHITDAAWAVVSEWGDGSDSTAYRVDQMIDELALEFPNIHKVDAHRAFADNAAFLQADQIHPNPDGQNLLFTVFENAPTIRSRFK